MKQHIRPKTYLFEFIKYINPVWYYNLKPEADIPYFVNADLLDEEEKSFISFDNGYSDKNALLHDAAYQAWNCGIIKTDPKLTLTNHESIRSVSDNYRFVRKYYHPLWSWFVVLLRLISLHNPIQEIYFFIKSLSVHRIPLPLKFIERQANIKAFRSELKASNPKVTVVIPTLNRYSFLADALNDLEQQDHKNFDVIIIDQSEPFEKDFYRSFNLDIHLIQQSEKALWLARNKAILQSDAEFLLLFDDDSRVDSDWISNHLICLDYFKCDISAGASISAVGAKIPLHYSYFRWGDQVDTGNAMIRRSIFSSTGLFDRQFEKQRMGDGEFGLRAYLCGITIINNPKAKRIHLKVKEGGLRQMGSWNGFKTKNWFGPRPVPSVLYFFRNYFGWKAASWFIFIGVPPSYFPYRYKKSKGYILAGFFLIPFIFPFMLWAVFRSWSISSKMIAQGALIEKLP